MKTVPLDIKTNVGLTTTTSGARSFHAFCGTINVPETKQTNIFMMHVIPDKEDEESFQPKDPITPPIADTEEPEDPEPKPNKAITQGQPQTTLVDLGPITHVIPEDQEPTSLDPHDELLRWHYRLGHLSFEWILQLAHSGQLPKRLLTCKKPFCTACQYGKMTKRPWRVKGDDKRPLKSPHGPGKSSPWTNWSPTPQASSPSLRANSRNNVITMLRSSWTSSPDTLLYTSSVVSRAKRQ